MQLYGRGIRRRLAPMLSSPQQLQLAYSLMMALPATPVLRYGDEIGMGDDLSLRERDSVRTPMQWSDEPNGGFSTAKKTILPVIDDGVWGYKRINVAAQRRDPNSLMNWMERMIRLRKECPEIGWGTPTILSTGNSNVLGMRYDWRTNSIVTLHNLDEKPKSIRLNVGIEGGERLDKMADRHGWEHLGMTLRELPSHYWHQNMYASFEEDIKGTLDPGKLADLQVYRDDPVEDEDVDWEMLRPRAVLLGGATVSGRL